MVKTELFNMRNAKNLREPTLCIRIGCSRTKHIIWPLMWLNQKSAGLDTLHKLLPGQNKTCRMVVGIPREHPLANSKQRAYIPVVVSVHGRVIAFVVGPDLVTNKPRQHIFG